MALEIGSKEEFEAWLEDKPRDWAQVIAMRCALRALPIVAVQRPVPEEPVDPRMPLFVFRAFAISFRGFEERTKSIATKAQFAAGSIHTEANHAYAAQQSNEWKVAESQDGASKANWQSFLERSAAITSAWESAAKIASSAADSLVAIGGKTAIGVVATVEGIDTDVRNTAASMLAVIETDSRILDENKSIARLLRTRLWPIDQAPGWWRKKWDDAVKWLSASGQGFEIWREWYYGRLQGLRHAFADFDDTADEAFYRWIVEQDNDWWSRDPAEVNADIKAKVDSLRTPIERPESQADFFISHAESDTATLNDLITVLDQMGKTYILPQRGGTKGQSYKAIERADRVIALYSDGYVQSEECADEWMHSYYLDASTAEQRMLAFRLDRADLKPLMNGLSFCDLTRLLPDRRKQAMAKWIEWKPRALTRENVEQTLTTHLDPGVIASADGKLDTAPDAVLNKAELPSELASAMDALRMMLDLARLNERNLSSMMQSSLRLYDDHFTQYGRDSSWRGLDRYIKVLGEGAADLSSATMREEKAALEQLIAAHSECLDALASADEQTRELANVLVKDDSPDAIESLIDNLKELQEKAREGDASTDKYDIEARNLVKQGREFAIEAGALNANEKPDAARKSFLRYVGGFGLKTLTVLASLATLRSTPENKRLTEIAEKLVEKFYEMVGL